MPLPPPAPLSSVYIKMMCKQNWLLFQVEKCGERVCVYGLVGANFSILGCLPHVNSLFCYASFFPLCGGGDYIMWLSLLGFPT